MTEIRDVVLEEKITLKTKDIYKTKEKIRSLAAEYGTVEDHPDKILSDGPVLKIISSFEVVKIIDNFTKIIYFFKTEGKKKSIKNSGDFEINLETVCIIKPPKKKGFFFQVFGEYYQKDVLSKKDIPAEAKRNAEEIIKRINKGLSNYN